VSLGRDNAVAVYTYASATTSPSFEGLIPTGSYPKGLAWSASLAMFTLGSAALWLGATNGWNPAVFRAFYLFGAILNVPFLALGTLYLLGGLRLGDKVGAGVALASAFAAGVLIASPLRGAVPAHQLPQGSDVFGALPRVLAAVASGVGAVVVVSGAAWSAWRLRARRETGRMVGANVLIAVGTIILGAGGLFNSALGEMEAFAVTLVVGITLIFGGFLLAMSRRLPTDPSAT